MLKILLNTELDQLRSYMGNHMFSDLQSGQINKFESYKKETILNFNWYELKNKNARPARIIIYYSVDHLFFICDGERCLNHVKKLIKEDSSNAKVLHTFFIGLIEKDSDNLQELEENITEVEDLLLTKTKRASTEEIITFRRELLRLKKYYEQLNQICEGLVENENQLIPDEDLRYFRRLDSKIDRLFSHILNLRDYVTQVREAYQAQTDIEQNNIMKVFTVITSVFLPLTLLVGWYGMNLKMPEFGWEYGYPMVILLSILVVSFCAFYFKRKKWF